MAGSLLISLDFELFWGVRDVTTLDRYGGHIRGVRQAIPAILGAFSARGIRATWATVGFLFFDSKAALVRALPSELPQYANPALSPYAALASIGETEAGDPYHFGRSLLDQIRVTEGQEIGSHTFSHYYALEPGQTAQTFREDLRAALSAGREIGLEIRSLVFPRNQYNGSYIRICRDVGLTSYRGNESSWIYRARAGAHDVAWKRGARLLDSYVNLSGHHTYNLKDVARGGSPYNLPASRFLRPWSKSLRMLEEPRLRRIEQAMTYAARNDEVFHLWWHPHNFGVNLERMLAHFEQLRSAYAMESASMGDLAARLDRDGATRASA